jgi:hypothetical protein
MKSLNSGIDLSVFWGDAAGNIATDAGSASYYLMRHFVDPNDRCEIIT